MKSAIIANMTNVWEHDAGQYVLKIEQGEDKGRIPGSHDLLGSHTRFDYLCVYRRAIEPSLGYELYIARSGCIFHISEHESGADAERCAVKAVFKSETFHRFVSLPEQRDVPDMGGKKQ